MFKRFASLLLGPALLSGCASEDQNQCSAQNVQDALLSKIYQNALLAAEEGGVSQQNGISISDEIAYLRSKPLLTLSDFSMQGISSGAMICTARISYHTSPNVRDPNAGFNPGIRMQGFPFDPPKGLFVGKAQPSLLQYRVRGKTSEIELLSGWEGAVTAAGMLALNRYFDRAYPDLKVPGEKPTDTTD